MKRAIRQLGRRMPLALRRWLRHRFGWRWLRGDYASWHEARIEAGRVRPRDTTRVIEAARAVRQGRGVWDRDGVVFAAAETHEPLLVGLRDIARQHDGVLDLIDFGGGLGSTWWQHRAALKDVRVRWRVVELPELAAAGRAEFADGVLTFHESLDAASAQGAANVILFSSVLQYVESPWVLLADVARRSVSDVIIDRVALAVDGRERLVVQYTPPSLGGGAMPCWLFDRQKLIVPFRDDYQTVQEWAVPFDEVDGTAAYFGMRFQRRVVFVEQAQRQ